MNSSGVGLYISQKHFFLIYLAVCFVCPLNEMQMNSFFPLILCALSLASGANMKARYIT
jgi:hypothetical protein